MTRLAAFGHSKADRSIAIPWLPAVMCSFALLLVLSPGRASAASSYTASDLGTLPGGSSSFANGVNDRGEIVGSSDTASGLQHAFSYTPSGGMIDLGTLPGGSSSVA